MYIIEQNCRLVKGENAEEIKLYKITLGAKNYFVSSFKFYYDMRGQVNKEFRI